MLSVFRERRGSPAPPHANEPLCTRVSESTSRAPAPAPPPPIERTGPSLCPSPGRLQAMRGGGAGRCGGPRIPSRSPSSSCGRAPCPAAGHDSNSGFETYFDDPQDIPPLPGGEQAEEHGEKVCNGRDSSSDSSSDPAAGWAKSGSKIRKTEMMPTAGSNRERCAGKRIGGLLVGAAVLAVSIGILHLPQTTGPYLIAVLVLLGQWFLGVLVILALVSSLVFGIVRRG